MAIIRPPGGNRCCPTPSARRLLPLLVILSACGPDGEIQDPTSGGPASLRIGAPGAPRNDAAESGNPGVQFTQCNLQCPADSTVVEFEGVGPSGFTPLTNQFAGVGVGFDSALVGVAPGYNASEYPPRSGSAVATADFLVPGGGSGILYLTLLDDALRVRGYVTSFSPLQLKCYNASSILVGQATFPGGNLAQYHGGPVNRPLEVNGAGIRSCQFIGPDNQYSVDDLTVVWQQGPVLACDTVVRGQTGSCRVTGGATVTAWEFIGVLGARLAGVDSMVTRTLASADTVWTGKAALSGTVSVFLQDGAALDTLTAPWVVQPRTGPGWRWGPANWQLDTAIVIKCNYPDLVLKNVNGVLAFTGLNAGRMAINRRGKDCSTGSIEPNMDSTVTEGTTLDIGGGPNASIWFVSTATFRMERVTELNPWLRPNGPQFAVQDSSDYDRCRTNLGLSGSPPIWVNFFTYNTVCQSFSLDSMFVGFRRHEAFGTNSQTDPLTANGHESRRRIAATDILNDPRAIVESFVSPISIINLRVLIQDSVIQADRRIGLFAGDATGLVKDNYLDPAGGCGKAWFIRTPLPLRYYLLSLFRTINGVDICV